jgi:hypothetical protein
MNLLKREFTNYFSYSRNVDARIELILQLLQIWRNHRQGISGQGGQINIAPLPYNPPTKAHSHSHSHGSDNKIPHHGHSHGHDDSDEDHSHEDHSHEDVDLQGTKIIHFRKFKNISIIFLTGADPEHKPGEVFVENFEKGVVQVDKKPIVPIGGHDH